MAPSASAPKQPGVSDLAHQIRNYSCFTWLNGSFILDWLIHNLDVCCWVKDAWPVSAQGHGGRQVRTEPDQLFDHYAVEYTFPDGTRLFAQGRHIAACWGFFGDVIHGAEGLRRAGRRNPRAEALQEPLADQRQLDLATGKTPAVQSVSGGARPAVRRHPPGQAVQRNGTLRQCRSGRHPGADGRRIGADDHLGRGLASNLELAPGLEQFTMDSEAPVKPGPDGKYAIAMPGIDITEGLLSWP